MREADVKKSEAKLVFIGVLWATFVGARRCERFRDDESGFVRDPPATLARSVRAWHFSVAGGDAAFAYSVAGGEAPGRPATVLSIMKVLVLGSKGRLGGALARMWAPDYEVRALARPELDVADLPA